jgi:sugar lactone lactonase YvrE
MKQAILRQPLFIFLIMFSVAGIFIGCSKNISVETPSLTVSTVAGSGAAGSANGTGISSSFNHPKGLAVDASGNLFVADDLNNLIRKISHEGMVSVFAGTGLPGPDNGPANTASFNFPVGIAVDAAGNVYVGDDGNNLIRKISPSGVVSTLAGNPSAGAVNGTGASASFHTPLGVAVDASGYVYVADYQNSLIRKISPAGVVTTFAGNGSVGSTDGLGTDASFSFPAGVTVDINGNVYVADANGCRIRKITPAGMVSTIAGTGNPGSADGAGTMASFFAPQGITVDKAGNLYVADGGNSLIRKISPSGMVTTVAGSGTRGSSNGPGASASFSGPDGLVVDASGKNLYIADTFNNLIRKIVIP